MRPGCNMLGFNSSAQAMFLNGIRVTRRTPYGAYSIMLFFPKPLCIPVNCTLIITAPSLRCRLTVFPKKDLALLALKFSILITSRFPGQRFWPSIAGRWAISRLLFGCKVWCLRFCIGLSRGFYIFPFSGSPRLPLALLAFKAHAEATVCGRGEVS